MRGKRKAMTPNKNGLFEGVVYRYVNTVEGAEYGWCYVGNTTDEKHRKYSWNNHGNKSYGGKKINEARKKYGLENFEYEVLERVEAETVAKLKAQLDEIETTYIKQFNSVEKGYNRSAGGTGNKGGISDEHRRNIGKASTGRIVSQETRKSYRRKREIRLVPPKQDMRLAKRPEPRFLRAKLARSTTP